MTKLLYLIKSSNELTLKDRISEKLFIHIIQLIVVEVLSLEIVGVIIAEQFSLFLAVFISLILKK